ADGIGRGTLAQWSALTDVLVEFEVLESAVDVASAFDGSLIDALYEDGQIN
ncbi:MAG: hypothetical protein HOL45_10975, partial [Chloroflexi bacterium]|nr:hypothetical protein [Chloroflexota bacterium]